MRTPRWIWAAALALSLNMAGWAQVEGAEGARIKYSFENAKLDPASYTMLIGEDGHGQYHSEPGTAAPPDAEGIKPEPVTQAITITQPLLGDIFSAARTHHFFAIACESIKDKVAFTGKKLLSYEGPDGKGACTFNYSRDQQVDHLADQLSAVAYTIDAGRKLAVEHEHDRLSLDAELESLMDAVNNGQALQLQNIAPQLDAIAKDESVMVRARSRANKLLAGMKAPVTEQHR